MEDYIKKAADAFLVERPYGMRVDYRKGGYVLFNRNLNVLFYRRVFLFGLYQPLCRVCAGSEEAQGLQSIYVPVGYGTEHEVVKS